MKRAVELFAFEERLSGSPFVAKTWRTQSEPEDAFMSVAVSHWEMVVTHLAGDTWMAVRGPETHAAAAAIPQDAQFFGIQFSLGTYLPWLDLRRLVDREVRLPTSEASFWLEGSAWELPAPGNTDVFVDQLARAGLLVHDPVAAAAVEGDDTGALSARSVERRVARATGLTRGAIRQIQRAETAVDMLGRGVPAPDVARRAGYADQPHLTRSLKRFVGQTPSEVVAGR
jgi:hypothetical protein